MPQIALKQLANFHPKIAIRGLYQMKSRSIFSDQSACFNYKATIKKINFSL